MKTLQNQLIKSIKENNLLKISAHLVDGRRVYYATYLSPSGKKYLGCAKSDEPILGVITSVAECVERYIFYTTVPDVIGRSGFNQSLEPVKDYGYFQDWQFQLPNFNYKPWNASESQDWMIMCDLYGQERLFPFEGGSSSKDYFRASSSGWSVHQSSKEAFENALLEAIERHILINTWLNSRVKIYRVEKWEDLKISSYNLIGCDIYLVECYGVYLAIVRSSFNGTNWFITTDCNYDPIQAVFGALNGIRQKKDWIIKALTIKKNFSKDASHFHRMKYYENGDMFFDTYLSTAREISLKEINLLPISDLNGLKRRLEKFGKRIFFKKIAMPAELKLPLVGMKVSVNGLFPGTFGADIHLPLYNFKADKNFNNKHSAIRYHPFA